MNAIEQMMQAFGATSPQQLSALFGPQSSDGVNTENLVSQFASALQESQAAVLDTQWQVKENLAVDTYTVASSEATSSLSSLLEQLNTSGGDKEEALASLKGIISGLKTISDDKPINVDTEQNFEGIPGLQLVQFSGSELTDLIESGQLQPPANIDLSQTPLAKQDIFLFTMNSGETHLLPLAQMEAINRPGILNAPGEAVKQNQNNAATVTAATSPQAASAASPDPQSTTSGAAIVAASGIAASEATNNVAGQSADTSGHDAIKDSLVQAATAHDRQPAKVDERSAEGNIVAHTVAQKNASANNQQQSVAQKKSQSATSDQTTAATTQTAAATAPQSDKPQATGKTADADNKKTVATVAQSTSATTAPARAAATPQQPVTWTPETISGVNDSSSLDALAAGLTSLKGEPGYMNSMGLMGGKPSAALGGQVAKQLNLAVTRTLKNGGDEFTMRLNPKELGNVTVKMAFGTDGTVSAKIFAERPETLELLQRETRGLERAIEAGGHKSADGGLSFSLDTNDGESAGKAFAQAVQEDQHSNKNADTADENQAEESGDGTEDLDAATLEEILAHVTPETGLDVHV